MPKRTPTREVALKIHRLRYGHDGKREFLIAREIEAGGLPLDAISLPLEGFETPEGNVCLAYPLLGKDLNRWNQDRGRPFSIGETRTIIRKTLEFLSAFHGTGAAHTDIKPDNFLYDPATGEIRLIDFGNAERRFKRGTPIATREYTPPEGIIGGELGTPVDLWSLACTMFEMLTGELLFDPHHAASKKYIEFSDDEDEDEDEDEDDEDGQAEGEADSVEEDEGFQPGSLVAGKYRIIEKLGSGNFATVWRANVEDPKRRLESLEASPPTKKVAGEACAALATDPAPKPDRAREARRNNLKRFGVTDTYDLALNYEHILLMQELLGPVPPEIATEGVFHRIYFRADGVLKFDPKPVPVEPGDSIKGRLRSAGIPARESARIESLLLPMLRYEPGRRATADQCLAHRWLTETA